MSGGYRTDLIMIRGGRKISVQAKQCAKNVGNKAAQEIYAGVLHYDADEERVVTNSGFTSGAFEQAQSAGVTLVDRDGLIEYIMLTNDIIEDEPPK